MGPIDEFISAGEYIVSSGNPNIVLCPRGTMPNIDGYHNHPMNRSPRFSKKGLGRLLSSIPRMQWVGAIYVPACSLAAIAYGVDGLNIETHINLQKGIGDDPAQSVTPDKLAEIIKDARHLWNFASRFS